MKRLLTWLEYRKQLRDMRRISSDFWHGWAEIPVAQQGETTFACERIGAAPAVPEAQPGPLRTPRPLSQRSTQ